MLAIVIPFYKIDFFEKTLTSLSNQYNKDFKVYIGNDASPENPDYLIKIFEKRLNIKYQKFSKNLGSISLTQQWERCIEMVEGEEWIMILGDDDVLTENVVEFWYQHFKIFNKKSNVVRFATRIINENSDYISKVFNQPIWEKAEDSFYRRFQELTRSSLSEHIFLKKAYDRIGFSNYPLAWHSDDKAWLEFSERKPIYSINEALVLIRNSDINISGKTDNYIQKISATKLFYKDVISERIHLWEGNRKISLIKAYEDILKQTNSLKLNERFKLLHLYILPFDKRVFKFFLKRSFIRFFNKKIFFKLFIN